jgi:hypothetical protein
MLYYNFFISNGKTKSNGNKHCQHLKWLIILWTHPFTIINVLRAISWDTLLFVVAIEQPLQKLQLQGEFLFF